MNFIGKLLGQLWVLFSFQHATQMGKKIPLDKSNVQRHELLDTLNFVNEAIRFTMKFT